MTFEIYRRRLPHWRLDGATYFVTWRLAAAQAELTAEERGLVFSLLPHFDVVRYALWARVVMNDHVHVLITPVPGWKLEKLIGSRKGFSSQELVKNHGRIAPVWQNESYDRIVRTASDFDEKRDYILDNAKKRWPEYAMRAYPWADARDPERRRAIGPPHPEGGTS